METWKPIPDYEGRYDVSDLGNVKSLARRQRLWHGGERDLAERILAKAKNSWGYEMVTLHKDGVQKVWAVHGLVAVVFLGPRPGGVRGHDVCHFDGDKANNALSNLRYDTRTANAADNARLGRTFAGEAHHFARLKMAQVVEIRERLKIGESVVSLASLFGVSVGCIRHIASGRTWNHA